MICKSYGCPLGYVAYVNDLSKPRMSREHCTIVDITDDTVLPSQTKLEMCLDSDLFKGVLLRTGHATKNLYLLLLTMMKHRSQRTGLMCWHVGQGCTIIDIRISTKISTEST